MIHARIDTVDHRKIVGFETGTRAQFDTRHGGDSLWVFLDSYRVKYRADFTNFLTYPQNYIIDSYGDIHISDEPPIIIVPEVPNVPVGYRPIIGRDGQYLKGADGAFLYGLEPGYIPPPNGLVHLTDGGNVFLKDSDNAFIDEVV